MYTNTEIYAVIQLARYNKDITPFLADCQGNEEKIDGVKALLRNDIDPSTYIKGHLAEDIKDIVRYILITGETNEKKVLRRYKKLNFSNLSNSQLYLIDLGMPYNRIKDFDLTVAEAGVVGQAYTKNLDIIPLLAEIDEIDVYKLNQMLRALENNLNIKPYLKGFSGEQLEIIVDGLMEHLDVSIYADKDYNEDQMSLIHDALKDGLNYKTLLAKDKTTELLYLIYKALTLGYDISTLIEQGATEEELNIIVNFLLKHIDITQCLFKGYTLQQLRDIGNLLAEDVYAEQYIKQGYDKDKARLIYNATKVDKDVLKLINPSMTKEYIEEVISGYNAHLAVHLYSEKYKDYLTAVLCNKLLSNNKNIEHLLYEDEEETQEDLLRELYPHLAVTFDISKFDEQQKHEIVKIIKDNLDISWVTPRMEHDDISILKKYVANGVDLSCLQEDNLPQSFYRLIAHYINKGINITPYLNKEMGAYQIELIGRELQRGTNLEILKAM